MVEIVSGETQYIQLPEDHPIKAFCTKYKIKSTKMQDELMKLINYCISNTINEMVEQRLEDCKEVVKNRELSRETDGK